MTTDLVDGRSELQADLAVSEERIHVPLPRSASEFKTDLTTHDVLTYSAKATRHKPVYRT